jgi:hypothetical protein
MYLANYSTYFCKLLMGNLHKRLVEIFIFGILAILVIINLSSHKSTNGLSRLPHTLFNKFSSNTIRETSTKICNKFLTFLHNDP